MNNFYKIFESKEQAESYRDRLVKLKEGDFIFDLNTELNTFADAGKFVVTTEGNESKFSFSFGDYRSKSKFHFIYPKEEKRNQ